MNKTFLYKALCSHYHECDKIVLCVTSSRIASLLLSDETTSHFHFKISLKIAKNLTCHYQVQEDLTELFQSISLIIWDEILMQHCYCFKAVDCMLHDVHNCDSSFSDCFTILSDDFAQILSIVLHVEQAATVTANLQKSYLWDFFHSLFLHQNMRVIAETDNKKFASWLNHMSYDSSHYNFINLSSYISQENDMNYLCSTVYSDHVIQNEQMNTSLYNSVAILSSVNDKVNKFNDHMLQHISDAEKKYMSVNKIVLNEKEENSTAHMFIEVLQKMNFADLSLTKLCLKSDMLIILLHNFYTAESMCNKICMIVQSFNHHSIQAIILNDAHNEQLQCISHIKLINNAEDCHFTFTWKQFSVHLSFAMIMNKSQRQSLQKINLNLQKSVFTHDQLYVTLSHVTDVTHLHMLQNSDVHKTKNVIFSEMLLQSDN